MVRGTSEIWGVWLQGAPRNIKEKSKEREAKLLLYESIIRAKRFMGDEEIGQYSTWILVE